MRKQRIDVLLHILTDQVEPDFHRDHVRIGLNFERSRLSKAEQESRKKANAILSMELEDMFEYAEETLDKVRQQICPCKTRTNCP